MEWTVSPEDSGQKLVNFLKIKLGPSYSARQIKQAIEQNFCQVNHRHQHFAGTVLIPGDRVILELQGLVLKTKTSLTWTPDDIVYEDPELLVYNKPAGFASDGEEILGTIKRYGSGWELLHRLDRETSGLLMFTKGTAFRLQMVALFKSHAIKKIYLAIVDGIPKKLGGTIDNYLGKIHAYEGQALWGRVNPKKGSHAITSWTIQKSGSHASLLNCIPLTGRTHQIRVHLSEMGHPILGDKQYGKKIQCGYQAPRCLLHAYELYFVHPTLVRPMHFIAPPPKDFKQALESLMGSYS